MMVTFVPGEPCVGVKPETSGSTVKFVALAPVPSVFVTEIGPLVAPEGTVAVSFERNDYRKRLMTFPAPRVSVI